MVGPVITAWRQVRGVRAGTFALLVATLCLVGTHAVKLRLAVSTRSESADDILNKATVSTDDLDRAWEKLTEVSGSGDTPPAVGAAPKVDAPISKEAGADKQAKYHLGQMKYGDCVADRNNKIAPPAPSSGLNECHPYENLACCGAEDAMASIKVVRDRIVGLFGECPTCYNGFMSLFCGVSCSPTQDTFLMIHERAKKKVDNVMTVRVCNSFCAKLYLSCGGIDIGGVPMREIWKSADEFCQAHFPIIGVPFHSALGPGQNSTTIVEMGDEKCFEANMSTDCDADHPFDPSGGGRLKETEEQKDKQYSLMGGMH